MMTIPFDHQRVYVGTDARQHVCHGVVQTQPDNVIGALVAGVVADRLGLNWAVGVVAALTLVSGLLTLGRLPETHVRAVSARSSEV